MRAELLLLTTSTCVLAIGCGPSPAMQPSPSSTPCEVVAVDEDASENDDANARPLRKPVEYVRMDEWQPPASVAAIEARIEPRGDRPHDYVHLPALTLHREIPPMTTWRVGRYWR